MWPPFQSLPAYLGGKRRLCPLMFAALSRVVPQAQWPGLAFLDPFAGGGSVSLLAKAQGFRVLFNDRALRSAIIGRALIENSSVRLTEPDVMQVLSPPTACYPRIAEERFSPGIFPRPHALLLDRALHQARTALASPKRELALLVLIKWALRIQPMSMLRGTDARAAATGDLDRVSARRLGHYLKARNLLSLAAFLKLAHEVNSGVFPGEGRAYQSDAIEFLARTSGDVAYVDAPYPNTTSYEDEYRALDVLLEGRELERSRFSRRDAPLDEIFAASDHVPVWVVSFNNAVLDLDGLKQLIRLHRANIQALEVPYRHLGSIATEVKNETNREFIIVATA